MTAGVLTDFDLDLESWVEFSSGEDEVCEAGDSPPCTRQAVCVLVVAHRTDPGDEMESRACAEHRDTAEASQGERGYLGYCSNCKDRLVLKRTEPLR